MHIPLSQLINRKIICAGITTFFFSIIYALVEPNPFSSQNSPSIGSHFHEAFSIINVYMIYAAPAIYIYGVAASIASELTARAIANKLNKQSLRLFISALFHCCFGLILLEISLLAALIFLITDTIISLFYKRPLTMKIMLASHIFPLCLWLASVAYINITHSLSG